MNVIFATKAKKMLLVKHNLMFAFFVITQCKPLLYSKQDCYIFVAKNAWKLQYICSYINRITIIYAEYLSMSDCYSVVASNK